MTMTIYELFDQIANNGEQKDFRYLHSKVSKETYENIVESTEVMTILVIVI